MKILYKVLAIIGLLLTLLPPILATMGMIDLELTNTIMLVGMVVWLVGATPWLAFSKLKPIDTQVEI